MEAPIISANAHHGSNCGSCAVIWDQKSRIIVDCKALLKNSKKSKITCKKLSPESQNYSQFYFTLSSNFKPTFSSPEFCHLWMAPHQRSANETFAVHNLVASTTKSIIDAAITSMPLASLQPASNSTSIFQPNSHAGSSLDPSSIQNVTFGVLAMVIGIGGLILAYAQLRKMRPTDMILERIENS